MKRKTPLMLLLVFTSIQIHSMTTKPKDEIAIPKENFRISITDRDEIQTDGRNVTFNEYTFLCVKKGSMEIYIPFERLTGFSVTAVHDELVDLEVTLSDGTRYEVTAKPDDAITGEAGFGQFRIELRHVKTFSIQQILPTVTPKNRD